MMMKSLSASGSDTAFPVDTAYFQSLLCDALQKNHLPVSAASAMTRHAALLLEYNCVMNLTAITSPPDVVQLHFIDSCLLLNMVSFSHKSVIDIGSGAGFPGLPLRMCDSSIRLTLLDAQQKRVDFLREVCVQTGLSDVDCIHARAEDFAKPGSPARESFDIVVSRAVAALPVLAELCIPFLHSDGLFLAMKSVTADDELNQSLHAIEQLGAELQQVLDYSIPGTDIQRRLILIRKVHPVSPEYPRPFAKIKKHPL